MLEALNASFYKCYNGAEFEICNREITTKQVMDGFLDRNYSLNEWNPNVIGNCVRVESRMYEMNEQNNRSEREDETNNACVLVFT